MYVEILSSTISSKGQDDSFLGYEHDHSDKFPAGGIHNKQNILQVSEASH
jgi:hypothetical protein